MWVAVAEGILVAFHVIAWWLAVVIAAIVIAFYLWARRDVRSDTVRQLSWIAAASQALVVLVPILVTIVGAVAFVAVGVLAVVALVLLFSDRG